MPTPRTPRTPVQSDSYQLQDDFGNQIVDDSNEEVVVEGTPYDHDTQREEA